MKLHIIAILLAFTSFSTYAQPTSTVDEGIMVEIGDEKLAEADYYNALDWYNRAYKEQKKKDNALRFKIAHLHYMLRDYKKAEKWFARCVKSDKKGKQPIALYYLAMAQKANGFYPDAINSFESFIGISKDDALKASSTLEIEGARLASKMKQDKALKVKNAGKTVNSKFSEFSPRFVGNELYYSSMKAKKAIVLDGKEGDYHAKIYKASGEDKKKGFAEAAPISEEINRKGFHTGNGTFSADGSKMFFTRAALAGNVLGTSEIYMAEKVGEGFAKATLLVGPNGAWIAKHPAPGELYGKEVLFFVSNMEGGKGGDDIYYCSSNGDGTYAMPINLGDDINTSYDEATPFYRDGKLWFSTNGRPSMGGLDIYSTNWNGSNWSKAENLGPGYNSSVDDFGFFVDESGYKGALVSNRPSINSLKSKTCCDDIFLADVVPVAVDVNTLVFGENKTALSGAAVQLIETDGEAQAKSNTVGNDFNFVLNLEKAYTAIVNVPGYYPDTITFNTVGVKKSQTISKEFHLKKMPEPEPETVTVYINEPIRLNRIYYDFDDDKILLEAEEDLTTLLGLMEQYPDMVIELSSHTDSQGTKTYNEKLSQRRADSAKKWLIAKGVVSDRIKAVGYGESQILNQCSNGVRCSDEEHRFNRRTEFKIIAGPTEIKIPKTVKKGETGAVGSQKKKINNPTQSVVNTASKPATAKPAVLTKQQPKPTKKLARLTLEDPKYNFGTIKEGVIIKRDFRFTNTGNDDLLIEIATGSCGCTVPEWPVLPIKPGQTEVIHVTFDSTDKDGDERVEVTIVANTEPIVSEIILTGHVIPKRDFKKD